MITHYFQMIKMALDAYIYAYCLMTSSKPKKYEVPITQISFIPINQNWKGKKKKNTIPSTYHIKMFIQVKQKQEKITHQKAAPSRGSFNSTHLGHL